MDVPVVIVESNLPLFMVLGGGNRAGLQIDPAKYVYAGLSFRERSLHTFYHMENNNFLFEKERICNTLDEMIDFDG